MSIYNVAVYDGIHGCNFLLRLLKQPICRSYKANGNILASRPKGNLIDTTAIAFNFQHTYLNIFTLTSLLDTKLTHQIPHISQVLIITVINNNIKKNPPMQIFNLVLSWNVSLGYLQLAAKDSLETEDGNMIKNSSKVKTPVLAESHSS